MAVGYQKGNTDGFASEFHSTRSINGPCVDGVSITYGTPRKHIWRYAIGLTDSHNSPHYNCLAPGHLVHYRHLLFIITTIVNLV